MARVAAPSRYRPSALRAPWWVVEQGDSLFQRLGHQVTFLTQVLGAVPHTLKRYRHQTGVLLVDVMWGNGSLIVGGGTIGVLVFMGAAVGASVGIEGYGALDMVGMGPLTGFVSAYANTRDFAGDPEAGTAGDLSPEGLVFIPASDSPTGNALVAVSFEVSGSVTVFGIED